MSDTSSVSGQGGVDYAVDIVLCIDVTGSMGPVINEVKEAALKFHDDLQNRMIEVHKSISQLRVRVVAYRDYFDNPGDAFNESPFYRLPDERSGFDGFVRGLTADGGGDAPESGLEALALAIHSDWERGLDKRRHVIVVFTDAPAHELRGAPGLPPAVPASFNDLTDLWEAEGGQTGGGMEMAAKRLLIYAPEEDPWNQVSDHWTNTVHYASQAGRGMEETTFNEILDMIAGSIG